MPIAQTYREARTQVEQLVERFDRNHALYTRSDYKETQVRVEFIDPFFEALGWDVRNTRGYAEQYKDVVHEDAIKVGAATRAPDYSFRIGGARKFFLEAKKPSVAVGTDVGPAYQLRRYAWSAKLPLSILTDFEEFAVYDCQARPAPGDKASAARVIYLGFDQYLARFDDVYGVFARESVLQGSFDRYVEDSRGKRGTGEVDVEFLKEIEGWREQLARNLALRNPALSVHELNFAVQHTIDRILFLRMAEDRGIEEYGRLLALTGGPHIYPRLVETLYRQADEKYDSGLFNFQADTLTGSLEIDDRVLKPILAGLYYPDSPYEFSVLPAEVLGQVYEQFLGKVIRLTAGHRAVVEEKPEVKKAGGVYYTPAYIVDYIVEQTVGRLVAGQSPRQLRAARGKPPLRILDPACGSGSFLLGAYRSLLDHYRRWYEENDPARHAAGKEPALYQGPGGAWRLTSAEKKRILLDHIYGVDLDRQAVEVTKLSLLLHVLEGETSETLGQQLRFWRERALPDLGDNIKCGNSLVGPEYFAGQLIPDEAELRRVNPFDWQAEFPAAMAAGGFDAIIGNPPYIRIQVLKESAPWEVEFYKKHYAAAGKGNYDIYVVFVERALQLLADGGRMGYILPHKFFQAKYGQPLRELIAAGRHLAEIVHFGDQQVFAGATTYTCLLFLDQAGRDRFRYVEAHNLEAWRQRGEAVGGAVQASKVTEAEWNFVVGPGATLFERLGEMPVKLGKVAARMAQGIRTSANEVYVLDVTSDEGNLVQARSKQLDKVVTLERESVRPFLKGREIKPYRILASDQVVILPYRIRDGRIELIPESEFRRRFPNTYAYLRENKSYLEGRERGRMKGSDWYGYVYPKNIEIMASPKILVPDIADQASFALDEEGVYAFTSGYAITLEDAVEEHLRYILALLNSKVLDFYLKQVSTALRGGFFRYFTQFIEQLPIRTIDFTDPADVARHNRLVALVEHMLDLHQKLTAATIPADRTLYQRQIDATERQIDALVYELYDLTADEIAIVEGETT
ncbi:MAG: Eco57I restriction-modification methylase domain-containing protein [Anaerolineae bacterium]|nr:Eco57I restriction-modification methylase domain-containing protein [Anaerolineae bacterium]